MHTPTCYVLIAQRRDSDLDYVRVVRHRHHADEEHIAALFDRGYDAAYVYQYSTPLDPTSPLYVVVTVRDATRPPTAELYTDVREAYAARAARTESPYTQRSHVYVTTLDEQRVAHDRP